MARTNNQNNRKSYDFKKKWPKHQKKADKPMHNKQKDKLLMRSQKAADEAKERQRIKEEKAERISIYKKKRLEKTKVLSKKTHRGQPLMKDRMQMLLKEIQEMKRS